MLEGLGEAINSLFVEFVILLCLIPFTLIGMWVTVSWLIHHVKIGIH